ncbi:MAG: type IX secretion system sortase PorU, partial [Ignavibacteriales bacterium]|nr:type IX secretion system sortase PorU [Ignavibacteriales bacterium]
KFKSPVNMISVGNQNLRGITSGGQYIIITPKVFREQADRLAKYRQESAVEKLSSIVIDIDEIFLEFGYGAKDPSAIRDFLTYAYKTWSNKPEFVFLFGDGDYDYRNIEGYNNNFIPTHQIEFSLDQVDSYSFDDFFACIDGNDRYSDIAIGRVTVQSASQAKIVVDKIISYETNTDKSSWRNLITLVSDDDLKPDSNEGTTHIDYSESLAELLPGGFVSSKIYGNLYPEVSTSYGRRRPASNKAIISAINNGTAIVNYYGHGSPEFWSDEQMFTNSASIPALNNPNYFFLAAATCDFGYFDKTIGMSGAEQLIVKENGGAIGTFATNRPVYAQPNQAINELFYSYLFTPDTNEANPMFPIGKVYMKTKQAKTSANDLKFHLFADPALRLILPISSGTIDSINGTSLKQIFQLKGLMKASISGRILKNNGIHNTEFNGEALLSVYDSKRSAVIGDSKANIELPGGLLFRGRVNIVNGSYSAFFVVPKDISSNNQLGKMTLYFFNDKVSGTAYSNNIRVGGFDTTPDDKKGPEISISFDSKMVNDTYVISPYSKMYVNLTDSTAVNTANTGIGHELSAVLNGDEANKIDLSTYYTADINSNGRSGLIEYPLNGLAEGKYTIRIYAYDVFNNLDSAMTSFQVVSSTELQATYITNYPNPFSSRTAFLVDHNFVSPLRISIKVFSVAGRLLHEISETVTNDRHVVIPWDGRDKEGAPLANGVYLYKVKLAPLDGQKSKTVNGKLAITR